MLKHGFNMITTTGEILFHADIITCDSVSDMVSLTLSETTGMMVQTCWWEIISKLHHKDHYELCNITVSLLVPYIICALINNLIRFS